MLTLREHTTKKLLYLIPISLPTNISIEWTHSVELTRWRETYKVNKKGKFELIESRFKSFGAGVPANEGKEFFSENGWNVMRDFNRVFLFIPIMISCNVKQEIFLDDKQIKLCDISNDASFLDIKNEKISIWQYIAGNLNERK